VSLASDKHRSFGSMPAFYRRALIDFVVIGAIVGGTFLLIVDFELFERFYHFSRAHEDWELDELIVAVTLCIFGIYVFGFRRLLDQRREIKLRLHSENHARKLAQVDPLTGLANRRRFEERLAEGLTNIEKDGDLALIVVDFDHFKPVNDAYGHAVGDQMLVAFADRAKEILKPNGFMARIGGDEFAVILEPLASDEEAAHLARRLLALFDRSLETDQGRHVSTSCSIGIAVAPRDGISRNELSRNADIALYQAKHRGGRNFCLFKPNMDADEQRRVQITKELREAIVNGAIEPFYQPTVDLRTRQVTGFEVVARWRDPVLGEVPSSEFMSVAADSGVIVKLSTELLRRACSDALHWPNAQRLIFPVSAALLANHTFVLQTFKILDETAFGGNRLEIEVAEAAGVCDDDAMRQALDKFRQAGIRVALDDFGEGNSSLKHLRQAHFDRIKISKDFVNGITEADAGLALVRAIVDLSRTLKIAVTAEGVECEETVALLLKEGCTEGQGPIFGKAVPASETHHFFR
jgi:diguanylate cyclase (GGDEF)-like protein